MCEINFSMSTDKHAYLIIAHGNPYVLEKLISLIDDERNDIYIHVDKKVRDFNFDLFSQLPKKSKLSFIDRINVYWGHVSQIETELSLFKAASKNGKYSYYHLISGADLPIKSQDDIHAFFKANEGKEFIGFSNDSLDLDKVNKIHLFPKYQRLEEKDLLKRLCRRVRNIFLSIQRFVGYNHYPKGDIRFVHGSNWVSITHSLVEDLLEESKSILRFYAYSSCADEIYKHTFVYNSQFRGAVYNVGNELVGCQRFMDWGRGRPYTFREDDFNLLMNSEMLFARKFEDEVDKKIVDQIFCQLNQEKHCRKD